jgi:hypothetical protein
MASALMAIDPSDILLTGRVAVVTGGGEGIGRNPGAKRRDVHIGRGSHRRHGHRDRCQRQRAR